MYSAAYRRLLAAAERRTALLVPVPHCTAPRRLAYLWQIAYRLPPAYRWLQICCATFLGWAAGLTLATGCLAAATVVWCRPYDTPPYLIPYYLRDVRSRFLHYASVRKRSGGPQYMTVEDFVLALIASPQKELPHPSIVADLQHLFQTMDANGDGFISFPEFRFLMSLLISRPRDIEVLFQMADTDQNGRVSLDQFATVLRGITKDEAAVRSLLKPSTRRNGIIVALFGTEEEPRLCSFAELEARVHEIRTEVWKAEFRQYDVERHDCITAEEFAELIANQVLGAHLPSYLLGNIRKMHGSGDVVTMDMWVGLNEMMLHSEEVSSTVEMYLSSGLPLTRHCFGRLITAAGLSSLPAATIDLIFSVFDKNGDGTMEMDEFLFIMQKKVTYHYSVPPRERKSLPSRFFECSRAALSDM